MKLQFLVFFFLFKCYIPNLVKIGPVVLFLNEFKRDMPNTLPIGIGVKLLEQMTRSNNNLVVFTPRRK